MYDLAVVGGGPGGYVAAIRAAQRGLKVLCVDRRAHAGGTCLSVGCIPSKVMLHATEVAVLRRQEAARFTDKSGDVKPVLAKINKQRDATVQQLAKGIQFLFKKNKVDSAFGHPARLLSPTKFKAGDKEFEAKRIIVATGSVPADLPGGAVKIDEKNILSSTGALALDHVPQSLVVIGGGVIGLEMATIFSRLGSKVEVVEFLPNIGGPGLDKQVSGVLRKLLEKQGIKIHTGLAVTSTRSGSDGATEVVAKKKDGSEVTFKGEKVLLAVGRKPNTSDLGLVEVGVEKDKLGRIVVDPEYTTSVASIKAIGDCVPGPMLAHKAEEDGMCAVENIVAELKGSSERHTNEFYRYMPGVVYVTPECAMVGATEDDLKARGVPHKAFAFPMMANSRSKCVGQNDGMVKVLVDPTSNLILGATILSEAAGEMITEFTLAMKYGLTARQLADTVHPHPTMAEALKEACLAASSKAIHL